MSEKNGADVLEAPPKLAQADLSPVATVDQNELAAAPDHDAREEAVGQRERPTGTEQRHVDHRPGPSSNTESTILGRGFFGTRFDLPSRFLLASRGEMGSNISDSA